MIVTYCFMYLIFPKFFKGKKGVIQACIYFILLTIAHFTMTYFIEVDYYHDQGLSDKYPLTTWVLISTRITLMIILIAGFIKTIKFLYITEQKKNNLEKKNLENKMSQLTSQLHPHFFFNTLNNLYVLSIEKSDKTSKIIMKLSDVMRYIIDDHNKLSVGLDKELEIIESYIEIEKIRYDENLKIEFDVSILKKNLKRIKIPPLLIFTFVENAFKHGVSKSLKNPWIYIGIQQDDSKLKICIKNSIDEYFNNEQEKNGIGLINVQKRLELYYPKCNKYSKQKLTDKYIVDLEIKIL